MSKERTFRWMVPSAFGVSLLALGLSLWTAGCREDRGELTSEGVAATLPPSNDVGNNPSGASADTNPTPSAAEEASKAGEQAKPTAGGDEATATPLRVKRLVVTTGIEQREPVEASEISAGAPVYAFVELSNPGSEDHGITVVFEKKDGPKVGHVELEVPAHNSRWRTWGLTRMIKQPGQWTAIVTSSKGEELARTGFEVS